MNNSIDDSTEFHLNPEPARPAPPQVNEIHTPDDLPALHRQLLELADVLAGRDTGMPVGQGEADRWSTAASKVDHLWQSWRPDWTPCACRGRIPAHVRQMQVRTCASCGEQEDRLAQTGDQLTGPDTEDRP